MPGPHKLYIQKAQDIHTVGVMKDGGIREGMSLISWHATP